MTDLLLNSSKPGIAAQVHGPENGPRFLALHGWLDNSATFATLAPLLPELRIVAIDLAGHGHSEHRSEDASYLFVDWIADVDRIVNELGWDTFGLIGHSLGGAIATMYAGTFPERITKLVTIEGLAPLTGEAEELPKRLADYIKSRAKMMHKRLPVYQTQEGALKARADAGDVAADLLMPIVERGLKEVPGGYTWRSDPRLKLSSAQRLTHAQVNAFLAQIAAPCLGFRATRGIPIAEQAYADFLSRIRNLKMVSVDGGHHVHLERPQEIAEGIRAFVVD